MYDMIISRVLNNPKIDKRTLLQKFISKIEMESNLNAGISSEISTIKELINKEDQLGNQHAISQHTTNNNGHHEMQSLKQSKDQHAGKDQAQSMKLIKANKGSLDAAAGAGEQEDSEIMLNVPSETMAGQTGVQDARVTRERKHMHQRPQHGKSASGRGMMAQHSQGRGDVKNTRITNDTSLRTRSSSHHHMRGGQKKHHPNSRVPPTSNEN